MTDLFCPDCRHCVVHPDSGKFNKCRAPHGIDRSQVLAGNPEAYTMQEWCFLERREAGGCGPEGRWFESKVTP